MLDAFSEHPIYFRLELKSFKYLMKKEIKNECLWSDFFFSVAFNVVVAWTRDGRAGRPASSDSSRPGPSHHHIHHHIHHYHHHHHHCLHCHHNQVISSHHQQADRLPPIRQDLVLVTHHIQIHIIIRRGMNIAIYPHPHPRYPLIIRRGTNSSNGAALAAYQGVSPG